MSTVTDPVFDAYAENYDDVLNSSIAASGETKEFFARGRMAWLAKRLAMLGERISTVLDFGCGTGTSTPFLLDILGASSVLGVDVSAASLRVAERTYFALPARFLPIERHAPAGDIDLAFSNGVFHHIAPAERLSAVAHVLSSLRPGGIFALWENNAWNPGTRYCMWVNPFDQDAIPVTPRQAVKLLEEAGLDVIETSFAFVFPRVLGVFRPIEPYLCRVPLGAQYLVLARKRATISTPHAARRPRRSQLQQQNST